MKLIEKILLAVDFRESSDHAINMAVFIARTFHSEIILVHVIRELDLSSVDLTYFKNRTIERLEKIKQDISKQGIQVKESILSGEIPYVKIIEAAEINDVNVIMMGSGEKDVKSNFPLGITTERLVQNAKKPVWVVKKGDKPPIKRILCPVDLSTSSERALENAIDLSRYLHAELTVLHVIQPIPAYYLDDSTKKRMKEQELYARQKQIEFEIFLKDFDFINITWNKLIKRGKAYEEILQACNQLNCQLLVMGAIGSTDSHKILMGKVTEKVMRELPCSVVTAKSEDIIQLRLNSELADIEIHFRQGKHLLQQGFAEESISQFQFCLDVDVMYAPAWEGLAEAHDRLGHRSVAFKCRMRASTIRKKLWKQKNKEKKEK